MSYKPKLNIDALIFSIDDVLVDVSASYHEVVRRTVQLYLEQAVGLGPSREPLLTSDEITLLQKVGRFTNYWDLATAFVMYFVEMLPPVPVPTFPSKLHVPNIIAYLQMAGGRLKINMDTLREQKDIARLAQDIAAAGGGIHGAAVALPRNNRHLVVASGNIAKSNLVGRIFQEQYLGAQLFEQVYQQPAVMIQTTGFIEHEALLIDPMLLDKLSHKLSLGVVSNRPRLEVEHTMRFKEIGTYFQTIITLDEVTAAGGNLLPDPWMLLEAAHHLQPTPTRCGYIGANPSDVLAAQAANQTVPFTAIACLTGAHDKEDLRREFEAVKANVILGHPNNLKELILG